MLLCVQQSLKVELDRSNYLLRVSSIISTALLVLRQCVRLSFRVIDVPRKKRRKLHEHLQVMLNIICSFNFRFCAMQLIKITSWIAGQAISRSMMNALRDPRDRMIFLLLVMRSPCSHERAAISRVNDTHSVRRSPPWSPLFCRLIADNHWKSNPLSVDCSTWARRPPLR